MNDTKPMGSVPRMLNAYFKETAATEHRVDAVSAKRILDDIIKSLEKEATRFQ